MANDSLVHWPVASGQVTRYRRHAQDRPGAVRNDNTVHRVRYVQTEVEFPPSIDRSLAKSSSDAALCRPGLKPERVGEQQRTVANVDVEIDVSGPKPCEVLAEEALQPRVIVPRPRVAPIARSPPKIALEPNATLGDEDGRRYIDRNLLCCAVRIERRVLLLWVGPGVSL